MLAFAGILVGESGFNIFGSEITGPAIFQFQQADGVIPAFTVNLIGLTAAVEGFNIVKGWESVSEAKGRVANLKKEYVVGDLNFDPLGYLQKASSAEEVLELKTKELNNGRLAMLAVAGIVAQELVTGESIF